MENPDEKKKVLFSFIEDCLSDLFYYNRKECESINHNEVAYLFDNKLITKKELKAEFDKEIDKCFEN